MDMPTEEALEGRIKRHLKWRKRSDEVALLWRGYLSGLYEWGLIELPVFERLREFRGHITQLWSFGDRSFVGRFRGHITQLSTLCTRNDIKYSVYVVLYY